MKFKVLIKRCPDIQRATSIAEEIARWSGNRTDAVLAALTKKSVCIRKEAEENEALALKSQFEAVGAEIQLVSLQPTVAPVQPGVSTGHPVAQPAANAQQKPSVSGDKYDDDEEEDEEGRVLSDEEYAQKMKERGDIFIVKKDSKLRNLEVVCLILGIAFGLWMSTREIVEVATDFFEKMPEERVAKIVKDLPETLEKKKEEEKKKPEEEIKTEKKKLKPTKSKGAGGRTGGGGDPRARVTRKGVLGIVSGAVKGKSVASADIFGKGGFASGIDAVLSGVGGLKSGGGGGTGRKGVAGIGYGAGYGSGFGGGSGGVDDLLGSLMGGDGGGNLNLKKRGELKVSAPNFVKGGALTGGRSKASIMRVVMQNLAALRYAYNKRLREKPGLKGKVTVKFAIDEFGKVIFCEVVNSTMGDATFENLVVTRVKRWVFEKIDKPGDVTEVVYPFVFSQ